MFSDLSAIIGRIYDAAIDPTLWQSTLNDIALFSGCERAALLVEDVDARHLTSIFMSFEDHEWVQSYREKFIPLNPTRIAATAYGKAGDIILTTDFMTQEEYEGTRYYKEWLQQRDFVDNPAVIVEQTTSFYTVLGLIRSRKQGLADEAFRDRMALIVPHLIRAVSISRALERTKLEALSFSEVLEGLSSAVLLVDANGRIMQANRNARDLLVTGSVLRTAQGVLRMHDPKATDELDEAIVRAADATVSADRQITAIALKSSTDDRYLASILPLTSGARSEIGHYFQSVAAIFVRRIGLDIALDPMPIARSYDLTPRELSVTITVVESGGVPETAAILGLSENTVRSHLQSIYRKTGAKNQSELSKLVASSGTGLQ